MFINENIGELTVTGEPWVLYNASSKERVDNLYPYQPINLSLLDPSVTYYIFSGDAYGASPEAILVYRKEQWLCENLTVSELNSLNIKPKPGVQYTLFINNKTKQYGTSQATERNGYTYLGLSSYDTVMDLSYDENNSSDYGPWWGSGGTVSIRIDS